MTTEEAADKIKGLIDIQKQNGNYNCNEYMYGMLIGMETAYYSLLGEEAKFTKQPKKWLKDGIINDFVPTVSEEVLDQIDKSVQNIKNEPLLPIPWELR
jgi:hypothetical protein